MIALWLLTAPAWATDVIVPAATPGSVSDFSVAYMFTDLVVTALKKQGLTVDDEDAIKAWAGSDAAGCFDDPACPRVLWDRTDARVAVVMGVTVDDEGLVIDARLATWDNRPEQLLHERVPNGGEVGFAERVAETVAAMTADMPERAQPTRVNDTPPREAPIERPPPPPKKKLVTVEDYQRDKASRREQAELGLPWNVYVEYRESGQKYRAWSRDARVRANKVWISAWGGVSYGDVDRGYSARQQIELAGDAFVSTGEASHSGMVVGLGPTFGGEIGYAPAWWAEIDIAAGTQLGAKHLDTGWECTRGCADPDSAFTEYDAAQSFTLWVEPRFKGVFLPTGYVKPYAFLGATVNASDGFTVPDSASTVDFPDARGSVAFGPTVGLGVGFDPTPEISVQLEVPYTIFLIGTDEDLGDATLFATPPSDFGGGLPGVVRGVFSVGVHL